MEFSEKFCTFTLKDGKSTIIVNLERVGTFESYHHLGNGWQFSIMYVDGRKLVVLEDAEFFCNALRPWGE